MAGEHTVGHLGVVDLAVGLDDAQRVGHGVRDDRGHEADEREAQQPEELRVPRGLRQQLGQQVVGGKPRVVPGKGGRGGGQRAPPETADAVGLDAVPQQRGAARSLGLQGGLDGVDGRQEDAEGRGAGKTRSVVLFEGPVRGRCRPEGGRAAYHRETKMVWISDGRFLRYEFECSSAKMPALAAVSPNRETGPGSQPMDRLAENERENKDAPWMRAAPTPS